MVYLYLHNMYVARRTYSKLYQGRCKSFVSASTSRRRKSSATLTLRNGSSAIFTLRRGKGLFYSCNFSSSLVNTNYEYYDESYYILRIQLESIARSETVESINAVYIPIVIPCPIFEDLESYKVLHRYS